MRVRPIRFLRGTARTPGVPFLAWHRDLNAIGPYRTDFFELVAVAEGRGHRAELARGGVWRHDVMEPGEIHLFHPADTHEIRVDGRGTAMAYGVAVPIAAWTRFAATAELARPLTDGTVVKVTAQDGLALPPFQRALDRFDHGPTTLDLLEFLAVTMSKFVEGLLAEEARRVPDWLWSAVAAMQREENLREGVGRLTELCHVSPGHLWRSTRRYFGVSPSALVRDLQVDHGATLLRTSEDPISVVGDRCGFADASHFSRVFRARHQVSPRTYRSQSRR